MINMKDFGRFGNFLYLASLPIQEIEIQIECNISLN